MATRNSRKQTYKLASRTARVNARSRQERLRGKTLMRYLVTGRSYLRGVGPKDVQARAIESILDLAWGNPEDAVRASESPAEWLDFFLKALPMRREVWATPITIAVEFAIEDLRERLAGEPAPSQEPPRCIGWLFADLRGPREEERGGDEDEDEEDVSSRGGRPGGSRVRAA